MPSHVGRSQKHYKQTSDEATNDRDVRVVIPSPSPTDGALSQSERVVKT
jgi:hypothetical protein